MRPYEALSDWLKQDPALASCVFFRGPWRDLESQRNQRLLSLVADGGPVDFYTRMPIFRIVLVGPLNWELQEAELRNLQELFEGLLDRLTDESTAPACGVAQINAISGIMGPGYTDTGRPWYGVTLQLLV